jgi:hypothetical protein
MSTSTPVELAPLSNPILGTRHRLGLANQRHRDDAASYDDDERSSVHQPSLTE